MVTSLDILIAADCLQHQKTTSRATHYRQEQKTEDKDYKSCTTEDREDTA